MELLVFGAGGHAGKIVEIARENGLEVKGFISTEQRGTAVHNATVLGDIGAYIKTGSFHSIKIHIAIGDNATRFNIYKEIGGLANNLFIISSRSSIISTKATVMAGVAIIHNAVLHANTHVGICSLIDTGAIIEHDCHIGDFCNIAPSATICGGATIHEGAIIGAGAIVTEKITIGRNALVGAGAVVINDIPESCVAVGNPARVIKERKFGDTYLR